MLESFFQSCSKNAIYVLFNIEKRKILYRVSISNDFLIFKNKVLVLIEWKFDWKELEIF